MFQWQLKAGKENLRLPPPYLFTRCCCCLIRIFGMEQESLRMLAGGSGELYGGRGYRKDTNFKRQQYSFHSFLFVCFISPAAHVHRF